MCVLAGSWHSFLLLVIARLVMALGASVGLTMCFTLLSDCHSALEGKKILAYLMMAFAITPGLGVALGGVLSEFLGWQSCFYASALYGMVLLLLTKRIDETAPVIDRKALKLSNIVIRYSETLKSLQIVGGSILVGVSTSFVYLFAAIAPFLVLNSMHLSPSQYGLWNLIPALGVLTGSHLSAVYSKHWTAIKATYVGLSILSIGTITMFSAFMLHHVNPPMLFILMAFIYIGNGFIFSNVSSWVMQLAEDKSSASAMMSFFNIGGATVSVLIVGLLSITSNLLLPSCYILLTLLGFVIFSSLVIASKKK